MFVLLLFICYLAFCLCFKNVQIIEAYILHVYDNVFLFKLFRGDILLLNICSSHINNQSLFYILPFSLKLKFLMKFQKGLFTVIDRAVGMSENPGVPVVIRWANLSPWLK